MSVVSVLIYGLICSSIGNPFLLRHVGTITQDVTLSKYINIPDCMHTFV